MKKNLLIAAIAITALASCTSNDFVGDTGPQGSNDTNGAISFDMNTPAVTRSTADDVTKLHNNFVVFGYKTVSSSDQKVFDNYQVNYVASSNNTTTSNSAGWEYVGYKNVPDGITTDAGVTTFSALTGTDQANKNAIDQTIKYWDFATGTTYDFIAYSLGAGSGTTPTYARASAITTSGYSLTGTTAELGACYISKKKHIATPASNTPQVQLEFVNFLSKIQLKFFETIPGYSVKNVKFYIDNNTKSTGDAATDGSKPALYGASNFTSTSGTYDITFDSNYNPVVALNSSTTQDSKVEFDAVTPATTGDSPTSAVWLSGYAARDYKETEETVYLGRAANEATSTSQMPIIPNSTGVALTLKMDYTLVSRDGTGETIEVKGATATIPAQFTAWKPNYAYTYIFKITDDKLVPITLDAIVTDAQDGSQETITTVSTPSITTYAKGSNITENGEYKTNNNIYVVVEKSGVQTLTVGTNAKLYTATIEDGAAQGITEETVKNAIATNSDGYDVGAVLDAGTSLSGYYTYTAGTYSACANDAEADGTTTYYKPATYSVKDANGKKLVINAATGLEAVTSIAAGDSPTGVAITVNGAKFTPTAAGTYVFEFIDTTDGSKKYYKIIKVVAP